MPFEWDQKFWDDPYISVCGGCSLENGLVHAMYLEGEGFKGKTFREFL